LQEAGNTEWGAQAERKAIQTSLRDCDGEMDLSLDPLQSRGWRRMGPERSARHYRLICGGQGERA